jgi:hypothetical protein
LTGQTARDPGILELYLHVRDGSAVDDASEKTAGCLLKASVDESRFADPLEAYHERNVVWEHASQRVHEIVLANAFWTTGK